MSRARRLSRWRRARWVTPRARGGIWARGLFKAAKGLALAGGAPLVSPEPNTLMSKKSALALSLGVSAFLGLAPKTAAQALLSLDVEERGATPLVASGFSSFLMTDAGTAIQTTPSARTFGPITVTLSGIGAGYDDRVRATPVNSGAFTMSEVYRDLIFSRDSAGTGGLDIDLTGLTPNQQYAISVFSFDSSSGGTRVSDWSANGVVVKDNYTFDGRVLPTDNSTYRIDF